jgi:hypothetical protein
VELLGPDGLLSQVTKVVLERALAEEMTGRLGYENTIRVGGAPAPHGQHRSGHVPVGNPYGPLRRTSARRLDTNNRHQRGLNDAVLSWTPRAPHPRPWTVLDTLATLCKRELLDRGQGVDQPRSGCSRAE